MAVEAMSGSSMAYQNMVSNVATKPVQQVKDAEVQEVQVEKEVAAQTVNLAVKTDAGNASFQNDQEMSLAEFQQEQTEMIRKSVEEINKKIMKNTECKFGIHEKTGRVTIKIVDKETNEVVREVPPEKTLEMIAKVWEFVGLLVDEKR